MSGSNRKLVHFVLIPFLAQGHMIPMIDLARVLSLRGALVTVVTTPANASRCAYIVDRVNQSAGGGDPPIRLTEIRFPCAEAGLPEGCESIDLIPSVDLIDNFFTALGMLREPLLLHLQKQRGQHKPSCLVSDSCILWTADVARQLRVPRLIFESPCCFYLLCSHIVSELEHVGESDSSSPVEPLLVPGLPHRVETVRAQSMRFFDLPGFKRYREEWVEDQSSAHGSLINTFRELESPYLDGYEKAVGRKVWSVGPLALCYKEAEDKVSRGNRAANNVTDRILRWLDGNEPGSVVYVNFGSLVKNSPSHLQAVGLGLEASNRPFLWAVKQEETSEVEAWLSRFEERTQDRGLTTRGWVPQVLILSHPSMGGFMTHCGWNSTLEAVAAGVPMITWPHFWDQFLNEKLVVNVLGIGVALKPNTKTAFISQHSHGLIGEEDVEKAVKELMDGGEEGEERRKRARELGEKARKAMEEGGSSYVESNLMIQHVLKLGEELQG